MIIGIIKEGKTPPDKRTALIPEDCKFLKQQYPGIEVIVHKSPHRAFGDEEYRNAGCVLKSDLKEAEIIFGVKEVELEDLIPNKTYLFFSHTIKKQTYNRKLLQTILERNIRLIDYECLRKDGERILGFGRYAGIVGAYNGLLAYGKRSGAYSLKAAHRCKNKAELFQELKKVELPKGFRIALSGLGRVAGGAIEILQALQIPQWKPKKYLNEAGKEIAFTQLSVVDYFKKPDESSFEQKEVFQHPERFRSNFMPFAEKTDLYISCHYWDDRGPMIFSKEELGSPDFRIQTIADISCDIAGPIPSTLRPSTIDDPIYEVNKRELKEVENVSENSVTVMAVDNLPCELPRDASESFSRDLLEKVLPSLLGQADPKIIEGATIAAEGKLMPDFSYLRDFVNGD